MKKRAKKIFTIIIVVFLILMFAASLVPSF